MATGNPFYVHPGNNFGQGLSALAGSVDQFGERQREQEKQAKAEQRFQEVQGAMNQAMQSGDPAQMKQVAAMYPEARESMELMFGFTNEQSEAAARQAYRQALSDPENAEEYLTQGINRVSEAGGKPSNMLTDLGLLRRNPQRALQSIKMAYAGIDPDGYEAMIGGIQFANERTKTNLRDSMQRIIAGEDPERVIAERAQMVEAQGGDPSDTLAELERVRQDPEGYRQQIENVFAMSYPKEYSAFRSATGQDSGDRPAGIREFESKVAAAGLEPGTEGYKKAALVALGLEPRAGISASERIAQDPALAQRVADLERQTTAAREEGKLRTQQQMLPKIRKSIKEAEQQAQSHGEALSEYDRAKAAQPGLREVVDKLKTLSDVATYTMGGKVFDTVVKELGFGATEGATARAKMESLVNNQILPLLRDTFGAQFTEKEGDSLRRTMMDIDAAPEQKKQILDSFIEQKMRDLEMKRGRVEGTGGTAGGQMSEEEADALINQMLEQ